MLQTYRNDSPRLSVVVRLFAGALGGGLSVLLGVSLWLTPSAEGLGTHRQLGLPPCTIVQFYGVRCPACGMTTSWAHLVRGQLPSACRANTGGVLLGVLALCGAPWLVGSACLGRWWGWTPTDRALLVGSLVAFGVILTDWLVRWWTAGVN